MAQGLSEDFSFAYPATKTATAMPNFPTRIHMYRAVRPSSKLVALAGLSFISADQRVSAR
jgi:hypothetical protein